MVMARRHAAHVTSFFEIDLTAYRACGRRCAPTSKRRPVRSDVLPFIIRVVVDA